MDDNTNTNINTNINIDSPAVAAQTFRDLVISVLIVSLVINLMALVYWVGFGLA